MPSQRVAAGRPMPANTVRTLAYSAGALGRPTPATSGPMAARRTSCKPAIACYAFLGRRVLKLPDQCRDSLGVLELGRHRGRHGVGQLLGLRQQRRLAGQVEKHRRAELVPRSASCCGSSLASITFFRKSLGHVRVAEIRQRFAARTHSAGVVGLVARMAATAASSAASPSLPPAAALPSAFSGFTQPVLGLGPAASGALPVRQSNTPVRRSQIKRSCAADLDHEARVHYCPISLAQVLRRIGMRDNLQPVGRLIVGRSVCPKD